MNYTEIIEGLILGAVQGIVEWLPLSSEGAVTIVSSIFFERSLVEAVSYSLFLHVGTMLATMLFYRKDIQDLLRSTLRVLSKKEQDPQKRADILFYFVATFVTGIVGLPFYLLLGNVELSLESVGRVATLITALALFVTGALLWYRERVLSKRTGGESENTVKATPTLLDGVILGLGQAFTVIPGLSRSGTTVSLLLLRNVKPDKALAYAFIMGIPVVFGVNIVLALIDGWPDISPVAASVAVITSFVVGLLTLRILVPLAKKSSMKFFAFSLGVLALLAVLFM